MLSIYKASAGSGKTFTLAYEYIKLLLGAKNSTDGTYRLIKSQKLQHRHILAITFTNKATDEMKQRIIHELALLAGLEPNWTEKSRYTERLTKELHCSTEQLTEAASNALRQLLFDFNFFSVSTIDSFFQTILRTFAHEADISGNYEVDLDSDRAIGQGVRDMFDSLQLRSADSSSRILSEWLSQYLLSEFYAGKKVMLFNRQSKLHSDFLGFIKNVSNDIFTSNYDAIMAYLSDTDKLQQFTAQIFHREQSLINEIRQKCSDTISLINNIGYNDGKLTINSSLLKQLNKLTQPNADPISSSQATITKVHNGETSPYNSVLKKYLQNNPNPTLDNLIMQTCQTVVNSTISIKLFREIRSNLFVLGLLKQVYQYIDQYRAENNTILLSDTNSILRTIIGDDDAPFIYERVGLWINHFLIDEFQDTSHLQWENLRPLLSEGISNGNDSLIIGDEKQCIYRFRFSDPTLLQSKVGQSFGEQAQVSGNNAGGNTNWRSRARVVMFNNELFRHLSSQLNFSDIYANVVQELPDNTDRSLGFVSVTSISGASNAETLTDVATSLVIDRIKKQLAEGYLPSDIVILTRNNNEATTFIDLFGAKTENDTLLNRLHIISDDAMVMSSSPAVRLIVSVLRYLDLPKSSPKSQSHKQACLHEIGLLINRYEHILTQNSNTQSELALKQALTDDDKSFNNVAQLGQMACFNLPSLVERIIVRYISKDIARQQSMYISAFVDVVNEFCSRGTADLHSFIKWWDESGHKSKISAPADENAIRIMTIHKSKGLEFKCVHIPFANWKLVNFKSDEWFESPEFPDIDSSVIPPLLPLKPGEFMLGTPFEEQYITRRQEQLLDELNVLYVAFTRASEELSIIYSSSSSDKASQANSLLQQALPNMTPDKEETLSLNTSSEDKPIEATTLYFGKPSGTTASKSKGRTAIQPTVIDSMTDYSTADRDDLWNNIDIESYAAYNPACERGTLLHNILERVTTPDSLEAAVHHFTYRGTLSPDESDSVLEHLQQQISRPDTSAWFSGYKRLLRERPMLLPDGKILRTDRMIWTADGHIDIIDYKFGKEHPKAYSDQVRSYMKALSDMGYENIRGFIWYVDSGIIRQVNL